MDGIYSIEIKIKDTTVTARSASYIDLYLDSDSKGRLRLTLYHKRDNLNFPIVNFPFICSKIPVAWNIYLSVDPIFQSLWFLSEFPR